MSSESLRIVIDLQAVQGQSRLRGIGRYSLSLALAIARQRREHEIIIALSDLYPSTIEPVRAAFEGVLGQKNVRVWRAAGPVRAHQRENDWRRSTATVLRDAFIASLRPDLVHVSSVLEGYGGDTVTTPGPLSEAIVTTATLYDLIPLLNPEAYLDPDPGYERHYHQQIDELKRADGWLAISESSAREGCDVLGLPRELVVNISAASDSRFQPIAITDSDEEITRRRFGLVKPFVLYTGGADGRKNLDRLIRAYARLPLELRSTHQLALAGSMPESLVTGMRSTARSAGLEPRELIFTGFVDDGDLVRLYNQCRLFVLPSTHEGFGLPALEAMACGAVVIGSNATSIPEVIGWSEALFDPFDEAAITEKVRRALTDQPFRAELIRNGTERVKTFSWDRTGSRALTALEQIYAARAPKKRQTSGSTVGKHEELIDHLIDSITRLPFRPQTDRDLLCTSRAIATNHPVSHQRQILVDVSQLVRIDSATGIQRVVRNVLKWLPEAVDDGCRVEPVHASVYRRGYRYAQGNLGEHRMVARVDDPPIEIGPGDVFLGLDLRYNVVLAQTGFYDQLRRLGIPVYFMVYDLLPISMPDKFPHGVAELHERWLSALAACDGAICISRSVADELASWLMLNGPPRHRPFRIGWFRLGGDHTPAAVLGGSTPDRLAHVLGESAARPTFLVVGTIEPRKGHAQALAAFEDLWARGADVNLVFAGRPGWGTDTITKAMTNHPEKNRRLHWLENTTDDELTQLYRASSCLLVASEGEGFGLPLIEAARHGISILARDLPVFREVAGNNALFFSGLGPDDLARAVRQWQELRDRDGLPRSSDITWCSWQESVSGLVDMLRDDSFQIQVAPAVRVPK